MAELSTENKFCVKFDSIELMILKSLIGKKFVSFSCGTFFFPDECTCYGKLHLRFEDRVIEVNNFLSPFERNPGMDEVAMLTLHEIDENEDFHQLLDESIRDVEVGETVKAINILENKVKIYSKKTGAKVDQGVFDNAFEIRTDKRSHCFYSNSLFTETINYTNESNLKYVTPKALVVSKLNISGFHTFKLKQKIISL